MIAALVLALVVTPPESAGPPLDAPAPDRLPLEYVYPTLGGKNQVRWWEFDWRWSDFTPVEGGAPVRLYFYEEERPVAEIARALTSQAYAEYVDEFEYTPTDRIPYILYNSHAEFESTNAFFVSEQVLGVTSTTDLTMALPYWGEHQRFRHVMRHELAHQFMIQLVQDAAAKQEQPTPLGGLPLWFVEGLAQHFALRELTPEVRAVLVDRLHHKGGRERDLPDFFDLGPMSFERVYVVGHAQVQFLEDQFGEGTVRRILELSPTMVPTVFGEARVTFQDLVAQVTKATPRTIEERWRAWALRMVAPQLDAAHAFGELHEVEPTGDGEIDSLALAPDGRTLFYRTFDRDTGVARLYLRDVKDASSIRRVRSDQGLGLVSLHPLDRRVTALGRGLFAFVGRRKATDVLFVGRWERREEGGRVRLSYDVERTHALSRHHALIEAGYPVVDERDGSITFVGLSREDGFLDLYRMDRPLDEHPKVTRLTKDPYAERDLAMGADGTLYYASDATPEGRYELFERRGAQVRALTHFGGEADVSAPSVGREGEVYFAAAVSGFAQAYRWKDGEVVRVTDVPTAFGQPHVDAAGDLLGVGYVRGERRLYSLPRDRWTSIAVQSQEAGTLAAFELPREHIDGSRDYEALKLGNYGLADARLLLASGPFLDTTFVFTDLFRSSILAVSAQVVDDWDRTSAAVTYVGRGGRVGLGASLFVDTGLQLGPTFRATEETYLLQRLGAAVHLEFPFNRFMRVEGFASPQVVRLFDFAATSPFPSESRGTFYGGQVGGRFVLDTLRWAVVGPVGGVSFMLDASGTGVFNGPRPFATTSFELDYYRPFTSGERIYLFTRLAAGSAFGDQVSEQFYLPAAYNLRAFRPDSFEQIGTRYSLGTAEVRFPLDAVVPFLPFLEGVVGGDVGSIYDDWDEARDRSVAAAVAGLNIGLGPIALRLHFARAFRIGDDAPVRETWRTHLSFASPFLF